MPTFSMQTIQLPKLLCDAIDRNIWNFILGSQGDTRKPHLFNWSDVCKPKKQGGLGLRSAREINASYLMKLAWKLWNESHEFWIKVLKGKYIGRRNERDFKAKGSHSSTWKSICLIFHWVQKGVIQKVGDGTKAKFWEDCWLDNEVLFLTHAVHTIDSKMLSRTVASYIDENGCGNGQKSKLMCLIAFVLNWQPQ